MAEQNNGDGKACVGPRPPSNNTVPANLQEAKFINRSLFRKSALRRVLFELAEKERPGWKFTRVPRDLMWRLEGFIVGYLREKVKRLPSKGATIDFDVP